MTVRRALLAALVATALVNALVILAFGTPWARTVLQPLYWFFTARQGGDSWRSMARGWEAATAVAADGGLYARTFFDPALGHEGFQYPPTALLIVALLHAVFGPAWETAIRTLTWIAVPATALFVFRIADDAAPRRGLVFFALVLAVTLTFYPVMRAYRNGQIQTWLNAAFAASLWALLAGRAATSGVIAGLSCLVKPQAILLLVWAAARREWRFAAGFSSVLVAGLTASVACFGVAPHAEYLAVLRFLGRHGESFFPNQSVNGLLHRALHNGDNLIWREQWIAHFPPFHPVVYAGTLITSAAFVVLALVVGRRREPRDRGLDLAAMILAATLGSPIAWEHHYGILLPIFALLLRRFATGALPAADAVAAGAAYVVASNVFDVTNGLADTPVNVLQSTLLFAALTILIVLVRARRAPVRSAGPR
jgi:hypothetical protein